MTPWNIPGTAKAMAARRLSIVIKAICAIAVLACLGYWLALVWGWGTA